MYTAILKPADQQHHRQCRGCSAALFISLIHCIFLLVFDGFVIAQQDNVQVRLEAFDGFGVSFGITAVRIEALLREVLALRTG